MRRASALKSELAGDGPSAPPAAPPATAATVGAPAAAAPAATDTRVDQLARLRDSGVLDEQEFGAEKARILGYTSAPVRP